MSNTASGEGNLEIPADTLFGLLSDRRRRVVLRQLGDPGEWMEVEELAAQVASRMSDTPREALSNDQRQHVLASLHHNHLPRLADAGVLDYDRGSGSVVPTARAAQFDDFLDLASQ